MYIQFFVSFSVSILPEDPRNFNVDNIRVAKILVRSNTKCVVSSCSSISENYISEGSVARINVFGLVY